MLEFVTSLNNYAVFHDTKRGNYKIHDGNKVVAHPSTKEDAYRRLDSLNHIPNRSEIKRCYTECKMFNCNDCDRYS